MRADEPTLPPPLLVVSLLGGVGRAFALRGVLSASSGRSSSMSKLRRLSVFCAAPVALNTALARLPLGVPSMLNVRAVRAGRVGVADVPVEADAADSEVDALLRGASWLLLLDASEEADMTGRRAIGWG